jgi:hypothetical protein
VIRALFGIILVAGCRFGVDPVDVVVDAAVQDLPFSVADLTRSPDLTAVPDLTSQPDLTALPDLALPDLALPDLQPDMVCVQSLFTGFGAGGAVSPVQCPCGCILDDFTSFSSARWTSTVMGEWSATMAGGVLTMATAGSNNVARPTLSSDGKFYLDGDFDLVVDYKIVAWAVGGGANLTTLGPGNTAPTVHAHTYLLNGGRHLYVVVDNLIWDMPTSATQGTFEIKRTGSTLCATSVGTSPKCRNNSEVGRVTVSLQNTVDNATCSSVCSGGGCCAQTTEYRNLKLVTGTIVDMP